MPIHLEVAERSVPLNLTVSGGDALQLAVEPVRRVPVDRPLYEGPQRVVPSIEPQVLATDGCRVEGDIEIQAVPRLLPVLIRPDAELVERYEYDKWLVADEGIARPNYSTSAKTLKASQNLAPTIRLEADDYSYYIVERMLAAPEYSADTLAKGREEYFASSYLYELIDLPPGTFVAANGKELTTRQLFVAGQGVNRMLYWSSASAVALATNATYGVAMGATAPTIASDVMTVKSPTLLIRGNTTYFTSAMWALMTDIRYQYVIEVYRAPKGNLSLDGWGGEHNVLAVTGCQREDGKLR